MGRCGLCATTLFSDGGRHRSRVPIGGIYNAVFIRRPTNSPVDTPHTALRKNKTPIKIKRRIKRKAKLDGGYFALCISPLLSNAPK
nr:MAG TPA: hypothetical protein [Bacteriophage sp.]